MTQPPPGAFDARVNDCNPEVVPGAHWMVTDVHEGVVDRLTVPSGGAVVVGGGAVVVVGGTVVGVGASSSVVVALRVRLDTLS